jgi:hypothetical protein
MSYRDICRNPSSDPIKDREFLDSTQVKHFREGVLFDIELMERSPRSFRGLGFKPGNEAVWTSTLKPVSEVSPFEDPASPTGDDDQLGARCRLFLCLRRGRRSFFY